MNLYLLFLQQAAARPAHPAIEFDEGGVVTYQEPEGLSRRMLAGLSEAGVKAGDVIGLMLPRDAEHVAVMLAVLGLGGAIVPLRPGPGNQAAVAGL